MPRIRSLLLILAVSLLWSGDAYALRAPGRAADFFNKPGDAAIVRAASGTILSAGQALALPVEALNVQGLGAATVSVGYDPTRVRATACQRNSAFDVGLCNILYDRDSDGTPDAVIFNLVSLTGVSGSLVTLVQITWARVGASAAAVTSTLNVEVQTFTDADAVPLPVTAQNGEITVAAVPTNTPTPTPTPTPSPTPTLTPTATRDPAQPLRSHVPWIGQAAQPPATPSGPPTFTCGGWCAAGSLPGTRRQTVTCDKPVADWRMWINGAVLATLVQEAATSALAEAPEAAVVRIEALYEETWLSACKSVVACAAKR